MVFFIFRVLINSLVLWLTVWLLPGLSVAAVWWQFLLMGLIFTVLDEIVRPILVFFSTRLVIRSLGVFMIVVNAGLLLLLVGVGRWLGLGEWHIQNIVSLVVAGGLIGLLAAATDALLGINRPSLHNLEEGKGIWGFVNRMPLSNRSRIISNTRFLQVYDIVWRYGLDIALSKTVLGPVRDWFGRVFKRGPDNFAQLSTPAQVRVMLQVLGPTYVKFGQMVSSRSDALPQEWREELDKLQSNVAPFPAQEAAALVEAELGAPVAELYASFELEPFAAASTAQVHRATLCDGAPVVVKVQRPLIVPKVNADLAVLNELVGTLADRSHYVRDNDFASILDEFGSNLVRELDYTNEAYNALRLAMNMQGLPGIVVPAVIADRSTARVMTQEFVKGVKIVNVQALDEAGLDRRLLAMNFLRAMIKQILFDGFFHGDPHPGNVLVDLQTGDVIFLDMGMMGKINLEQRMNVADLLWALNGRDPYELATVFLRLTKPFKEVDVKQFRADMEELINRYMVYTTGGDAFGQVLSATLALLYESGLRLDSALTLTLKALVQAEEITRVLDPSLWLVDEGFRFAQEMLVEQATVQNLTDQAQKQITRTARDVLRRLPELASATTKWLDQYEQGKVTLTIDTSTLDTQLQSVAGSARHIAVGLIMLGVIVGSGIATTMEGAVLGISFSAIAFLLFVIGVGVSLAVAWNIYRAAARPHRPPPRLIQ